jgi:hypothetical protein
MVDKEKGKIFVRYTDDNDQDVKGYFDKVEENNSGTLIIYSGSNKIRIPAGRWFKTKEGRRDE